jgi:carboxyl-terminal processing protease
VIALPGFYEDFEARQKGDREFRSASRDVARLLGELKKEKVDSVLIDLRNNGGGSLTEAVELTGLFVGKGPVVQQRDAKGKLTVAGRARADVAWDGPLGVLIDRGSASASEIFAAAIQDYGRGVVIGEPSFGKGTVQAMINLDQVAKSDKQGFGELKLTVAQFFRINGGTTQLRGVNPDIQFPAIGDAESFGESSYNNALPWVQVKAAEYLPSGDLKLLLPDLLKRHEARVKSEKDFKYLQEDIAEIKVQRKKNLVSLNEAERRRERDVIEARLAAREMSRDDGKKSAQGKIKALRDDGLQAEERALASELATEKEGKNAKDVILNEAVHILGDEVGLLEAGAGWAARTKPGSPLSAEQRRGADAARAGVW